MDLLDEDGRCRRTDLLPAECGCAAHRGGEVVDLGEHRNHLSRNALLDLTEGLLISHVRTAKYDGRCKLDSRHKIEAGSEIGLAVQDEDLNDEVGWVCELCVRTITT